MSCASCHEPHGSISGVNLTAPDIRGVCIRCHADKVGPYTFEHADLLDDCGNCHQPHGSPFAGMLLYQEPFLCLQCHPGHTDTMEPAPSEAFKRGMFTKCSSCHSQIHGTDTRGDFPRSRFLR